VRASICARVLALLSTDSNIKQLTGGLNTKILTIGEVESQTIKAPTSLLLDSDQNFVAFGECARNRATQDSTEDLDTFNRNFMYLEDFKMGLKDMKPGEEPTVKPTMGLQKDVLISTLFQVICEQTKLGACREHRTHSRTPISTVTYVMTHPVEWKEPALQLMKSAAEKGGLLIPTDAMCTTAEQAGLQVPVINPILLLSEPEAAVLYATQEEPVKIGDIIMVVDNGAGTTDISTHEIGTH